MQIFLKFFFVLLFFFTWLHQLRTYTKAWLTSQTQGNLIFIIMNGQQGDIVIKKKTERFLHFIFFLNVCMHQGVRKNDRNIEKTYKHTVKEMKAKNNN